MYHRYRHSQHHNAYHGWHHGHGARRHRAAAPSDPYGFKVERGNDKDYQRDLAESGRRVGFTSSQLSGLVALESGADPTASKKAKGHSTRGALQINKPTIPTIFAKQGDQIVKGLEAAAARAGNEKDRARYKELAGIASRMTETAKQGQPTDAQATSMHNTLLDKKMRKEVTEAHLRMVRDDVEKKLGMPIKDAPRAAVEARNLSGHGISFDNPDRSIKDDFSEKSRNANRHLLLEPNPDYKKGGRRAKREPAMRPVSVGIMAQRIEEKMQMLENKPGMKNFNAELARIDSRIAEETKAAAAEQAKQEAARQEAARLELARQEAAKQEVAQREVAAREALYPGLQAGLEAYVAKNRDQLIARAESTGAKGGTMVAEGPPAPSAGADNNGIKSQMRLGLADPVAAGPPVVARQASNNRQPGPFDFLRPGGLGSGPVMAAR